MKSFLQPFETIKSNLFRASAMILGMLYSFILSAQDSRPVPGLKKNEIYASYGTGTIQEMAFGLSDAIATGILKGITDRTLEHCIKYSGAISAGYFYRPNKKLAAGISGTTEFINVEYEGGASNEKWVVFALSLNGRFYYISKPSVQLYSGLGAGYLGVKKTSPRREGDGGFGFQVNALGLRIGRNISFFGELGFGYQGIVSGGVSVPF